MDQTQQVKKALEERDEESFTKQLNELRKGGDEVAEKVLDELFAQATEEEILWIMEVTFTDEGAKKELEKSIKKQELEAIVALAERGGYSEGTDITIEGDKINMTMGCLSYVLNNVDEEAKKRIKEALYDGQ